jgi:tRNA(Ile)-lysidine synthase
MVDVALLSKQTLQALAPWLGAQRWLVAYSGGLDSSVLLHLLANVAQQNLLPPLVAVHVNHQMQPQADAWQRHCEAVCKQLPIEVISLSVTVEKAPRSSLEDAARNARYAAFESVMCSGDVLLLAHHADDQAETFLLRALRGAGVAGLAAMPFSRAFASGTLVRPLLDIDRASLQRYATENHLDHIDDPSNADTRFDRNFLRNTILPQIAERWPKANARLNAAARHLSQANELMQDVAQQDLTLCDTKTVWGSPSIALPPLAALTPARRRNALRHWLAQLPMQDKALLLSEMQLEQLEQQWFDAREDSNPCVVVGGVELRRYRDRGFCVTPLPVVVGGTWNLREPFPIEGIGILRAEQGSGGLRQIDQLDVRFRSGGETFCGNGGHHQPLKKWMQEHGVPMWLRDRLPLLFYRDELIAIADLEITPMWREAVDRSGWKISLSRM